MAALQAQSSAHKRNRSNPFKILAASQKDFSTHNAQFTSKTSPQKHLTRSHTDIAIGAALDKSVLEEIQNEQRSLAGQRLDSASKRSTLHKRTRSAISLKGLAAGAKNKSKYDEKEHPLKNLSKKSKSSTNLAAIFSRPKSRGRKENDATDDVDKENVEPSPHEPVQSLTTPIWAEFAKAPNRGDSGPSAHVSFPNKGQNPLQHQNTPITHATPNKGGSRVQEAIAAFDCRSKDVTQSSTMATASKRTPPDRVAIEIAFEALLDSRNIPTEVRDRMRTMELNLKADFVHQNQQILSKSKDSPIKQLQSSSPLKLNGGNHTAGEVSKQAGIDAKQSAKKSRPRSFTLTPSKNEVDGSPSKKAKHARSGSRPRPLSIDLPRSWSSTSLSSQTTATSSSRTRTPKQSTPQDFIAYFRLITKPQDVEVGRLQKLRQMLRNETVEWVESFIANGGFEEVVALLHRIIKIEWREEHEDNLLHHTLNCLKALCTTSSGVSCLSLAQAKLFPALLQLLFSSGEAKKGPSEYTTRELIVVLMFAYLQASADGTPAARASTILSYLRDPEPSEAERPPAFMLGIHRPRPFRKWVSEISAVTKEVFWIFLHHVNVIPFPVLDASAPTYLATHFPVPRPPVAAAPYVGSVEWDATNYLATHIDLVNGLVASLPTVIERNALRHQLLDSGLEKVMGVSLRTCKEKFYGSVHAALSTWVGAADMDGWGTRLVRQGPTREEKQRRSPRKRQGESELDKPPILGEINFNEGPKLGLNLQVTNPDTGSMPAFLQ